MMKFSNGSTNLSLIHYEDEDNYYPVFLTCNNYEIDTAEKIVKKFLMDYELKIGVDYHYHPNFSFILSFPCVIFMQKEIRSLFLLISN